MPKRIQRRRTKGWRMPPNTLYVGRPSKWGNSFTIGCEAWRFSTTIAYAVPKTMHEVLEDYRDWLLGWIWLNKDFVAPLRGKDLACWCPLWYDSGGRVPCHADILLEIANEGYKTPATKEDLS